MGAVIDFTTYKERRELSDKLTELVLFHPRAFLDLFKFCNNPKGAKFTKKSLNTLFDLELMDRTLRVPLEVRSALSRI